MKFFFAILMLTASLAHADIDFKGEYPTGPDLEQTPGSLCDRPDQYRYDERVPYCKRDVDGSLKNDVFKEYRNIGYRIDPKTRSDYKIDHLIPLCAGGSNRENNLWPQHKSVYDLTDPLEFVGCEKLKIGKIKQADLIKRLLAAKRNLKLVPSTLDYFESL